MAEKESRRSKSTRWAEFRFAVIGPLLAAPPPKGELHKTLDELATKRWTPPGHRMPVKVGLSTIERWYYQARADGDPVAVLRRKLRTDRGVPKAIGAPLRQAVHDQYAAHRRWSYKLHYDNLVAAARRDSKLGVVPAYSTIRRYMKAHGLFPQPRRGDPTKPGVQRAEERLEAREVRSWEVEQPNALWHLDFHSCSRQVLTARGERVTPHLLGILDDHSRLCCHLQWYLAETAENLIHALCQGFQKRGLPRALMTDNGSAMIADETTTGLMDSSVIHETTLPHSPYQNGKQECFWGQVEGRLMAMLEKVKELSLNDLNEATQAWVEMEYNRKVHSETGQTPLERWLAGKDASRPCPSSDDLRLRFTQRVWRSQRRSDGTVSLASVRFELPSAFRHFEKACLRYASWDLSRVWLWDDARQVPLARIFPLDKSKNADARRRTLTNPTGDPPPAQELEVGLPPLMSQLIETYRATGLPPAFLPKADEPAREET